MSVCQSVILVWEKCNFLGCYWWWTSEFQSRFQWHKRIYSMHYLSGSLFKIYNLSFKGFVIFCMFSLFIFFVMKTRLVRCNSLRLFVYKKLIMLIIPVLIQDSLCQVWIKWTTVASLQTEVLKHPSYRKSYLWTNHKILFWVFIVLHYLLCICGFYSF